MGPTGRLGGRERPSRVRDQDPQGRVFEEEQAKLKDREKALEEGQPVPNPLRDGRATPDRWDDSDLDNGDPPGEIPEGGSGSEWPTRPNSEQGEEGQDFVF